MELLDQKHTGTDFFALTIPYDRELIRLAKNLGRKWSPKHKVWLFEKGKTKKEKLVQAFHLAPDKAGGASERIPEEYINLLERRRYSKNTIQNYTSLFGKFLAYFEGTPAHELTDADIAKFQNYLVSTKGISISTQNQYINAIKFYFEKVLGRDKQYYQIYRPIKEFKLPKVLSEKEVTAILSNVTNLKHKAMLLLVYSAGLRAGELVNLRISDIDSEQMRVFVRGGKGKKDRVTILSEKALEVLRVYFKKYWPKKFLFEGQKGGPYSDSSLRRVFSLALRQAGITKKVTLHSLRHSFATHLLESGADLRYIQELLGHNSSKTTEIYTDITHKGWEKIRSPLNDLELDLKTHDSQPNRPDIVHKN